MNAEAARSNEAWQENYWDPEHECLPREALEKLQLTRLRKAVRRAYDNVLHYRRAMQEQGLTPDDVRTLDDLKRLPFTVKQDLRDNYPFGLFAVPQKEIVRVHVSSGTTGKPTVVGYTQKDLEAWAEVVARALTMAGGTQESIIHNAYGYGLFTGGLGIHYGAERLGATIIPASGGNSKRQIMLWKDLGPTILTCTPSYALHLAEVMQEMGVTREEIHLKAGIFGAEPWTAKMRDELEAKLGIVALDIYGLSEITGPGVACECRHKNGLHISEDYFLPEVLDPETGETLPDGVKGELVLTCLNKEGLPLIRYRTRDITALHHEPCACGRTMVRMDKVSGRTDDMLIIRGVNVFPSQIESVLLSIGQIEPHYLLVVDREHSLDSLEVRVEVSDASLLSEVKRLEELAGKIRHAIETVLGISVTVKLVEPRSIPRSEGKAKRVVDRREL